MSREDRSQPQKAVDDGYKLPAAQVENEGDYGITIRQPGCTTEDQRLKCCRVLPRTTAAEVYGFTDEPKLCIDSNSTNRQSVKLCQERLTVTYLFDKLHALT